MTRKIVVFTKVSIPNSLAGIAVNFRRNPKLSQELKDIYIFLHSQSSYAEIKKMMQSANRIKINKIYK